MFSYFANDFKNAPKCCSTTLGSESALLLHCDVLAVCRPGYGYTASGQCEPCSNANPGQWSPGKKLNGARPPCTDCPGGAPTSGTPSQPATSPAQCLTGPVPAPPPGSFPPRPPPSPVGPPGPAGSCPIAGCQDPFSPYCDPIITDGNCEPCFTAATVTGDYLGDEFCQGLLPDPAQPIVVDPTTPVCNQVSGACVCNSDPADPSCPTGLTCNDQTGLCEGGGVNPAPPPSPPPPPGGAPAPPPPPVGGGCTDNMECASETNVDSTTPYCNLATGQCQGCGSAADPDGECSTAVDGFHPFCNAAGGNCIQCRFGNAEGGDLDCFNVGILPYCSSSGECIGCDEAPSDGNALCDALGQDTPFCQTSNVNDNQGTCVQCLTDEDCSSFNTTDVCDSGNFCSGGE